MPNRWSHSHKGVDWSTAEPQAAQGVQQSLPLGRTDTCTSCQSHRGLSSLLRPQAPYFVTSGQLLIGCVICHSGLSRRALNITTRNPSRASFMSRVSCLVQSRFLLPSGGEGWGLQGYLAGKMLATGPEDSLVFAFLFLRGMWDRSPCSNPAFPLWNLSLSNKVEGVGFFQ